MKLTYLINKDEMKNRAIFIEFRMYIFHGGNYCLYMIVGSDSEAKGSLKQQSDPTIMFKQFFPKLKFITFTCR